MVVKANVPSEMPIRVKMVRPRKLIKLFQARIHTTAFSREWLHPLHNAEDLMLEFFFCSVRYFKSVLLVFCCGLCFPARPGVGDKLLTLSENLPLHSSNF